MEPIKQCDDYQFSDESDTERRAKHDPAYAYAIEAMRDMYKIERLYKYVQPKENVKCSVTNKRKKTYREYTYTKTLFEYFEWVCTSDIYYGRND